MPKPLDTGYWLKGEARDAAGNTINVSLAYGEVRINPRILPLIPEFEYQEVRDYVRIETNNSIPFYPATLLDYLNVSVRNVTTNATLYYSNTTNVSGLINTTWNATATPNGTYWIWFEGHKGRATTTRYGGTVNVTATNLAIMDVTQYRLYAQLTSATSYHLYRLTQAATCSSFTVTVTSLDGTDVNLYLNRSAPEPTHTDGNLYDVKKETSATQETHGEDPAVAGTYALLIKHAGATSSLYKLDYTRTCTGGGSVGPLKKLEQIDPDNLVQPPTEPPWDPDRPVQ